MVCCRRDHFATSEAFDSFVDVGCFHDFRYESLYTSFEISYGGQHALCGFLKLLVIFKELIHGFFYFRFDCRFDSLLSFFASRALRCSELWA